MQQTVTRATRAAAPRTWRREDGSWNIAQIIEDMVVMLAIACGILPFFIINGHWSVAGLGLFLRSLGDSGQLAWSVVAAWQVNDRPVIPWVLVVSASGCQIMAAWRRRNGDTISRRLAVTTAILSLYDLGTTFMGTGTVPWIARFGVVLQIPAALIVTFLFEIGVGTLLSIMSNAWRRE